MSLWIYVVFFCIFLYVLNHGFDFMFLSDCEISAPAVMKLVTFVTCHLSLVTLRNGFPKRCFDNQDAPLTRVLIG